MKALVFASTLLAFSLTASTPVAAGTLSYPSADKASFVIDYPDTWEMEPGENVGDYVSLSSPSGVTLQLRTLPGTDDAMDELTSESLKFFGETFTKLEFSDPQELEVRGLKGTLLKGSGVDTEKQEVNFAMLLVALPDGNLADIWYAAFKGDAEGSKEAAAIMDSFRTP